MIDNSFLKQKNYIRILKYVYLNLVHIMNFSQSKYLFEIMVLSFIFIAVLLKRVNILYKSIYTFIGSLAFKINSSCCVQLVDVCNSIKK